MSLVGLLLARKQSTKELENISVETSTTEKQREVRIKKQDIRTVGYLEKLYPTYKGNIRWKEKKGKETFETIMTEFLKIN